MSAATILTASGRYLDLLAPEQYRYEIAEIARVLSRICRFGGHTRGHYSVAQHCAHVSLRVPAEDALAGLLHDAAEAYVGDVTQPLKQLLPEYRAIEQRIERAILRQFGVDEIPPSVRRADLVMLATERRDLMPATDEHWPCLDGIEPLAKPLRAMKPWQAEVFFLERYDAIRLEARAAQLRRERSAGH